MLDPSNPAAGAPPSVDDSLIILNEKIGELLRSYLTDCSAEELHIRFDLPEEEPGTPTISIFLYDVQEDLQMRSGERRAFLRGKEHYEPGVAHVQCCYRITYWNQKQGKSADTDAAQPGNQALKVMNRVLIALLNNRELPGMSSYCRVIPPSEGLNSLGNFWQAMDNKPKLSFSYLVTVPLKLYGPPQAPVNPVCVANVEVMNMPQIAIVAMESILKSRMLSLLSKEEDRLEVAAKLKLYLRPMSPNLAQSPPLNDMSIRLSGALPESTFDAVAHIMETWLKEGVVDDRQNPIRIREWQREGLLPVTL